VVVSVEDGAGDGVCGEAGAPVCGACCAALAGNTDTKQAAIRITRQANNAVERLNRRIKIRSPKQFCAEKKRERRAKYDACPALGASRPLHTDSSGNARFAVYGCGVGKA
jgi:hypothetical protein